jgi:hypothetical protein
VVEPSVVDAATLQRLKSGGLSVHAYLSVGERPRRADIDEDLQAAVLGDNEAWGTLVMDPADGAWRDKLLAQARSLVEAGYDGFFLDTVDSFLRYVTAPDEVEHRWHALAGLVRTLHEAFPGRKVLINRGFELLPAAAPWVDAVVAESLLCGWDPLLRRYVEVPAADRRWLADRLREVRDRYGKPAVVIDYVPPDNPGLARRTARAIVRLGFVPYVATPSLDRVGVGPPPRGGRDGSSAP